MKLSPSISYKNLSNKLSLGSYHPCLYTSKNTVYTSKNTFVTNTSVKFEVIVKYYILG